MKFVYRLALLTFGLLLAACGTVATPVWSEQAQGTQAALAVTDQHLTEIAPTATATSVPTETPTNAPTATSVPATATEAATVAPTATVEQPTATVEQAASSGQPNGDPEKGKEYFNTVRSEVNFACATCHHFDTEAQLIGPGLLNVSTRAESRVPGESAYDYIHTSIVNPSAFVVPGFPDKLMPQVYKDIWTEEQINDIIAYLYTLKG